MRFIPFVICLCLLPFAARADEAACLATPIPDCLFQIAATRAAASDDFAETAGDLLAIAALQETCGAPGWDAITRAVLERLQAGVPDATERVKLMIRILPDVLVSAPQVAGLLVDGITETEGADPLAVARLRAQLLAHAGRIDALRALISKTDAGLQADVALAGADALLSAGNVTAAYGLVDLVRSPEFRNKLDATAVLLLLRQDKVDAAEVAAAMAGDPATRAEALVHVAQARAEAGKGAAARALLTAAGPGPKSARFLPFARAQVWAWLGEVAAMEDELARLENGLIQPRRLADLRAVAALVSDDVAGFLEQLALAERPNEAGFRVKSAVRAALQAGLSDPEKVLAALPAEVLPYGLNAVGLHQAQSGAVAAADATLDRLLDLGPQVIVHGDFRAELARQRLAAGDRSGAASLAAAGDDPRLIAEIAGRLAN